MTFVRCAKGVLWRVESEPAAAKGGKHRPLRRREAEERQPSPVKSEGAKRLGGTLRARRRQAFVSTYGKKTHADFPRLPAPAGVRLVAGVILFRGYTALGRSGVRRLEQSRISSDPSQAVDKCSTAAG
jgi:hypothetical protein